MSDIARLTHTLSPADVRGMWRVRWGIGRDSYTVEPGLYRLGDPVEQSPILVTCNYRFTVDVLRRDTEGLDAWLLVLDTKGVNVWCAAGKGTFGTAELIRRLMGSELPLVAESQTLVLPQLGAVGVAAHEVRRATGYRVVYGPVYARDLREFFDAGMKATPQMRSVTFTLAERLELVPVELVGAVSRSWWAVPALIAIATLAFSLGTGSFVPNAALAALLPSVLVWALAILGGALLVPALLPWLPGRAFSVKGAVAGGALALIALVALPGMLGPRNAAGWAAAVLGICAFASYLGVNFTGSTPYTSPTGVERELRRAIPLQAGALAVGVACWAVAWFLRAG